MEPTRIVVVEDDAVTAKYVGGVLEAEGYEVAVAVMAVEALGVIESHRPHVVVTDVSMPGASGVTLLEHLRRQESTRDLPVLVYTSLDDTATRAAVQQAGFAEHLAKPAAPGHLLAAVERLVVLSR